MLLKLYEKLGKPWGQIMPDIGWDRLELDSLVGVRLHRVRSAGVGSTDWAKHDGDNGNSDHFLLTDTE